MRALAGGMIARGRAGRGSTVLYFLASWGFYAALGCGSDAPADTSNSSDAGAPDQVGSSGAAGMGGTSGSMGGGGAVDHDGSTAGSNATAGSSGAGNLDASGADVRMEAMLEDASPDAPSSDTASGDAFPDGAAGSDAPSSDASSSDAPSNDAPSEATASDAGTDATAVGFQADPDAVYVSISDGASADDVTCGLGPVDSGQGNHPCQSIAYGLGRATSTHRSKVLVADGTYNEAVTLVDGKSMYGGYRADTWQRHLATTVTVIQGVATVGTHDRTVIASSIVSATIFEGFVVRGSTNAKSNGNSYALYVAGSNENLVIRNNAIFAGRGGPGDAGSPGMNGTAGANGATYTTALDSFTATGAGQCDASNNRAAAGAGALTCLGVDNVGGGNGGGNNCTPVRSTQSSTMTSAATAGQPGAGAGGGTAGAAGTRGYDGELTGSTCFVPVNGGGDPVPTVGADGKPGGDGGSAAGVAGCSMSAGSIMAGDWIGGSTPTGLIGANGGGGGGGGAGGGAACTTNVTCKDLLGGHGGGGATGGCGGSGGGGGRSGGGSFGIFIVGTAAPVVSGNTIVLGSGGPGGGGGIGGAGGLGGTGTQGGKTGALFCTGKGGRGGDGGNGGPGSGGGGGCGGASFGIYSSGIGTPNYCAPANNAFAGGSGGEAGPGGYSGGNSGGDGVTGAVANCSLN